MKILLVSLAAIALAIPQALGQLSRADFEKLHAALQPDPSETWRQIPWKISVLEGQRLAAAEGKPLFIWAMDGHPLGCT